MVGHSFGGLYSRYFAAEYPEDVAGNVLIEATSPDFLRRFGKPEIMPNSDRKMIDAGPLAARVGILRLFQFVPLDPKLPETQRAELRAFYSSNKFADTAKSTFHDFPLILAQVRSTPKLGSRPLLIVVGSNSENAAGQLFGLQQELAALSSDSVVRIVPGADHTSLVRGECDSVGTVGAILEVVEAARTKMPLQHRTSTAEENHKGYNN